MEVAKNTVVSLRYCMKNSKGDILQNILESGPVEYLHGIGNIMPALEDSLNGLQPGTQTTVRISPKTDMQLSDEFYFDVVIDAVRPATAEEIAKGLPASQGATDDCGPGCNCNN